MSNIKEACCLLLFNANKKILLQHRDYNAKYFTGNWGLIGGAMEDGETPEECIIRECYEEINIWIESPTFLFTVLEHCKEYVYCAQISNDIIITCNEGIEMKYVSYDSMDEYNISHYHKKIIDKYIKEYVIS